MSLATRWVVLWTHKINRVSPPWNDGELHIRQCGKRAVLLDENHDKVTTFFLRAKDVIEDGADLKTISHRIQVQHQLKGGEYWESVKKSNPVFSQVYGQGSQQHYVDRSASSEPPIHTILHDLRPHPSTQFRIPASHISGNTTLSMRSESQVSSFQSPFLSGEKSSQPTCSITKFENIENQSSVLELLGKRARNQVEDLQNGSQPSQIFPPSKACRLQSPSSSNIKIEIDNEPLYSRANIRTLLQATANETTDDVISYPKSSQEYLSAPVKVEKNSKPGLKSLMRQNGFIDAKNDLDATDELDTSNVDGYDLSHILGSQESTDSIDADGYSPISHVSESQDSTLQLNIS